MNLAQGVNTKGRESQLFDRQLVHNLCALKCSELHLLNTAKLSDRVHSGICSIFSFS